MTTGLTGFGALDVASLGRLGALDVAGLGALAVVVVEWLALGWLSGVSFGRGAAVFWAPRWALRLLVGAVLVSFAELLLALVGVGFSRLPVVLGAAAVGAVALRVVGRQSVREPQPTPEPQPAPPRMDTRERWGWLLLAAVLLAATVRAWLVPEAGWDAFSHWGLRAQAYALAGTIVNAHSEHEYYPPLVPLLEAWLYLHRGLVSIDLGKTVWAIIGSAFGGCLAWHLRLILSPRHTWQAPYLAAGVITATTALLESFWTGQADLPLTVWLTLATLGVLQWQRAPERAWLVQAGLFSAAAAVTKFEGLPRIGVVVLAIVIEIGLVRKLSLLPPALVLLAAALTAAAAWTVFELTHGITANGEHIGQFQPQAIGPMLLALAATLGGLRTGGAVVVAVLAWAVAGPALLASPTRLIPLIVVGELAATLVAFLLSSTSPELEVSTSATRLFEQFLPLALLAGPLALFGQRCTYNRRGR